MAARPERERVGRDNSFHALWPGPLALAVPGWLWLVVLYFALVFGLAWMLAPDTRLILWVGALGPGVIGLIDLVRRLRTDHYEWRHPQAGLVVTRAGLVDRLTFRECGWYLPVLVLPVPLWLLGLGLSATFLRTWLLL